MSNQIGHFEILSELAKSATGAVYKANDPQTSQTVALKTIQLSAFGERSAELEQSLLAEAEAAKVLSHPNLAPVSALELIDGQLVATMEYIQGNSIATMLARKEGFSIWDLLDIGRQVCAGLDHARSHNIFHYSLESGKIMCGWDGGVRILGYGVTSVGKFTAAMPGVPSLLHYMSPEQVRGESIDARSNLFSLGAMFYEMVTDRKAFDGEDAEFLRRSILEGTPVAPALINPKIHPLLSDLIMKAIHKDPEARYQSGRELLDHLEKCKESKPQAAKAQPAPPPVKTPAIPDAVKAATQAKFIASAGQPPQNKPVERKIPAPSFAPAKTASAAAGVSGTPAASIKSGKPSTGASTRPSAAMSSPVLDAPAAESDTARISVDPLMAEGAPARAGSSVSFSEMTELPPLKEVYIAPPPPPADEQPPAQTGFTAYEEPAKPKIQPRKVAKNAIKEIKGVPPRLIIYSIAGAAIVIVLIALYLVFDVNRLNNDGDSPRPAAAAPAQSAPNDAAQNQPQSAPDTADAQSSAPVADAEPEQPTAVAAPRGRNGRRRAVPSGALVAPGQLAIDSTPSGAQVQIDGKKDPSWVTPFTLSGVAPGQHSISVTKPGYSSDSRTVDVASGSKAFVQTRLTQLMASLAVTSSPAGANVYIDGKITGKVTPAQIPVEKGQHLILVRKSGYIDDTKSAQFVLGQTVSFSPELRPLGNVDGIRTVGKMKKLFGNKETKEMGTVSIRTQPKGAQVAVNQHMLDKDSPVDFMLDPGNYIVDITMSGYAPIHKIITVDKGARAVIDEVLQHD